MTANAGYHAYATGDVLTAAQVQYNLQNQTVMYFATTTARDAALTGSILVDGMVSYTPATGLMYYNGTAWNTVGSQSNTPSQSNPVLNSAFQVWQRGTTFAISNGQAYTADRWQGRVSSVCTTNFSRQTTSDTTNLPNIQYNARIQRASGQTATPNLILEQSFETINSIPFAGKTVTFSFYARAGANYSSTSNLLNVYLYSGTGTDQNIASSYTGVSNIVASTPTLTTTWQRFTYTGTVPTTCTEIAAQFFYTATGTAGAADYFEVTGVQIEQGSVATPFDTYATTYQGELAACQRYYYRQTAGSSYGVFGVGVALSTTIAKIFIPFPVTARNNGATTQIEYSTIALYDGVTTTAITAAVYGENNQNGSNIQATVASGLTQYRPYEIIANNSTAAYIGFNSEL